MAVGGAEMRWIVERGKLGIFRLEIWQAESKLLKVSSVAVDLDHNMPHKDFVLQLTLMP